MRADRVARDVAAGRRRRVLVLAAMAATVLFAAVAGTPAWVTAHPAAVPARSTPHASPAASTPAAVQTDPARPSSSTPVTPSVVPAAAATPFAQGFVAPPPGSYRLQTIQQAPHGEVLDTDGRAYPLARYTRGRITLLGFIYTYCTDALACPLAYAAFADLHARMRATPALADKVRLVSLSFDPVNDTPRMMRSYGGPYAEAAQPVRWHFLTTRSLDRLKPIADGFGQAVRVQTDAQGRPTRLIDHMLKVFLLDPRGRVREIYSSAYLAPDVMFNDIRTLALEQS